MTRKLRPADFDRISFYAPRVKSLGLRLSQGYYLDHVALAMIFQHYQSTKCTLLPALRDLKIGLHEFRGLAMYPRLVLGPNVRSVTVSFTRSDEDEDGCVPWDNIAAVLKPHASKLTLFEVLPAEEKHENRLFYGSPGSMMDLCCLFRCLTVLDTCAFEMTHDVLEHLATIPFLQSLNCTVTLKEL